MISAGVSVVVYCGIDYVSYEVSGVYQGYTDEFVRVIELGTNCEIWIPWEKILRIEEVKQQ